MFSHINFNSSDSVNTWRNVSLQIVLITFLAYTKRPKIIVFKNTFCLTVDTLSFCHNFDCCKANPNTTLKQTMSLSKLKYGVVRQN